MNVCDDIHKIRRLVPRPWFFDNAHNASFLNRQISSREIALHFLREDRTLSFRRSFQKSFDGSYFNNIITAKHEDRFFLHLRKGREERPLHATVEIVLLDQM